MTKLKFSDGVEIETSGEFRILRLADGFYVVGHGTLSAVASEDEGNALIVKLKAIRTKR